MGLPRGPLSPGERQVAVLRPHVRRLAVPVLVLLVVAAATGAALGRVPASGAATQVRFAILLLAAAAAGRWVVRPFVVWCNTVVGITDRRLMSYRGVLRRTGHELPLHAVVEVAVRQTLLERALRSGTLTVGTGGAPAVVLHDVPEVALVEQAVQELVGRANGTGPDVDDRLHDQAGPDGGSFRHPHADPYADPHDDPEEPDGEPARADLRGGWRGYADDLLQEAADRERDFPRPQPPARRRFGRRP